MKLVDLSQLVEEPVSHDPQIGKRVMLRAGELPGLAQFARARFEPGQVASAHSHPDSWEVFLVESGRGSIEVDGAVHPLLPGRCVTVEPDERHELRADAGEPLVLTYFRLERR